MKTRRSPVRRFKRWLLLSSIVGGIASLALVATVLAATNAGTPPPKGTGVQVQQTMAAQATAAAQLPHAPKPSQTPTRITSCPGSVGGLATILPRSYVDPDAAPTVNISNGAEIPATQSNPFSYLIIAGALKSNPQQGVLVVRSEPLDLCAQGPVGQFKIYNSPSQDGALTLTQINGDAVSFSTAAGGAVPNGVSQFNFLTGQFS